MAPKIRRDKSQSAYRVFVTIVSIFHSWLHLCQCFLYLFTNIYEVAQDEKNAHKMLIRHIKCFHWSWF